MNVSKKALKNLVKDPSSLGTTDKYLQEGIVFLAQYLLDNDGDISTDFGLNKVRNRINAERRMRNAWRLF